MSWRIGYGLGDTLSNFYRPIFITGLPIFYTDIFGISVAAMGTMFLIVGIWDAVNDIAVCFNKKSIMWMSTTFGQRSITGVAGS
jgi:Na+/melibiose symporter-like transporter